MIELSEDLHAELDAALGEGAKGEGADLVSWSPCVPTPGAAPGSDLSRTEAGLVIVNDASEPLCGRLVDGPRPEWWEAEDDSASLDAFGGLLTSSFLRAHLSAGGTDQERLNETPLPAASRQRTAQMAMLFRAFQRADRHGRRALRGSIDRCVADLYGFSLQLLIDFEQHLESDAPH